MTAAELVAACLAAGSNYQRYVNAFVDAFRRASPDERSRMVADGPSHSGRIEGLVAAVASALCRETETPVPPWVRTTHSPEPFFAFPAKGFRLRLRLMLESPRPSASETFSSPRTISPGREPLPGRAERLVHPHAPNAMSTAR